MSSIDEIVADILTIIIFLIFIYYIVKKINLSERLITLIIITGGILIIAISDIISLVFEMDFECPASKVTAMGTLIATLGIMHAVAIYPKKNFVYNALPSLYVISGVFIIYLFISPHFLTCNPVTGSEHGAFWDIYVIWVYTVFAFSAFILYLRLITAKIKVVKFQFLYMSAGVTLTLIYLAIAQVIPIYIKNIDYFSAVHVLPILGMFFLVATVKYGMFTVTPVKEKNITKKEMIKIDDGEIVGLGNIHTAYTVFRKIVTKEPGIIITIRPPNLLWERYVMEKTPIIWLTYFPGNYDKSVIPERLHFEVMDIIINFVQDGGRIILVDSPEYFIGNFGRKFFGEFVEDIRTIGANTKIIIAVSDTEVVEGLADYTIVKYQNVSDPKIIMLKSNENIGDENLLVITAKSDTKIRDILGNNIEILRLTQGFTVDNLLFEGIKKIEDSEKKNVYIESMDYILSLGNEKNVMNLLKDIIDVVIPKGGKVYIRYTPRIEDSPVLNQFVDTVS